MRTGNSTLEASRAAPGPRPKPYTSQSPLPSRSVNREDPFEGQVCDSGSIPGQSQDLGVAPRPWPCDLGRVPSPLGAGSSSFGMTLPCSPWQPPRGQTQAASEVSSVSTAAAAAQATARQAPPAVGPWEPRPQRRPRPLASPCPGFLCGEGGEGVRSAHQGRPPGSPRRAVSSRGCRSPTRRSRPAPRSGQRHGVPSPLFLPRPSRGPTRWDLRLHVVQPFLPQGTGKERSPAPRGRHRHSRHGLAESKTGLAMSPHPPPPYTPALPARLCRVCQLSGSTLRGAPHRLQRHPQKRAASWLKLPQSFQACCPQRDPLNLEGEASPQDFCGRQAQRPPGSSTEGARRDRQEPGPRGPSQPRPSGPALKRRSGQEALASIFTAWRERG